MRVSVNILDVVTAFCKGSLTHSAKREVYKQQFMVCKSQRVSSIIIILQHTLPCPKLLIIYYNLFSLSAHTKSLKWSNQAYNKTFRSPPGIVVDKLFEEVVQNKVKKLRSTALTPCS